MKVTSVDDFPGQPGLQADDLTVKINEFNLPCTATDGLSSCL
jgi:hypothetical protein